MHFLVNCTYATYFVHFHAMSLSLITLNVERNHHWEKILPYLARMDADVLCLQEVLEEDVSKLQQLGYHTLFSFISTQLRDQQDITSVTPQGVCLCSKYPFIMQDTFAYYKAPTPELRQPIDSEGKRKTTSQSVAIGTVEKDGQQFTVATTHFTVTEKGETNGYQEKDMTALLSYLSKFQSLILGADMNIPRGFNGQYERLVDRYTDGIPKSFKNSIDVDIHRSGKDPQERKRLLKYVVDYIFTSHHYNVTNVTQKCGISDHCAFAAEIEKVKLTR